MASASTEQSFPSSSLSSRTVTESTETASTSTEQSFLSWPPSPPPTGPCVILGRVALLHYDAEHVPKQLTVRLAATPRVSTLTVPLSLHPAPDYNDYDRHPYVLAAGDAGLLLHVSRAPSIGFNLERDPPGILLVAQARDFSPSTAPGAPAGEVTAASVVRVPDRNIPHQHGISSIRSVGLVSRPGSGGADYMVAELRIPDCADLDNSRAVLYYFRSGTDSWGQRVLAVAPGGGPMPSFHDVVAHDGELWWVDLASGLFGCDPFAEDPVLRRVPFQFTYPAAGLPQDIEIETRRMVRVSQGKLRFVELACQRHDHPEETLVVIWTLRLDPDGFTWWEHQRVASLASIWESDRYIQLDLGEQVPELGLLHPGDADLVYFFLNRNLFSVDVHESMIKEYVHGRCNLVRVFFGTAPLPQISWRYVLAWELPPSLDNVIIPDKDTDAASTKGSESSNSRDVVDLNRPPIPSLNLGPVPMSLD